MRFIAPLDGAGGGSWLAVNERGLSIGLLNGYRNTDPPEGPAEGFRSRGLLPVSLIDSASIDEVALRLRRMELGGFRSFEILAMQRGDEVLLARWSGRELTTRTPAGGASPLVSSSFDTSAVRASRESLYRRIVGDGGEERLERHRAYHRCHHPGRGPYSPCMHRPDAKTVSFSHVAVTGERVCFHYLPHSPCRSETDASTVCLSRQPDARVPDRQ